MESPMSSDGEILFQADLDTRRRNHRPGGRRWRGRSTSADGSVVVVMGGGLTTQSPKSWTDWCRRQGESSFRRIDTPPMTTALQDFSVNPVVRMFRFSVPILPSWPMRRVAEMLK